MFLISRRKESRKAARQAKKRRAPLPRKRGLDEAATTSNKPQVSIISCTVEGHCKLISLQPYHGSFLNDWNV